MTVKNTVVLLDRLGFDEYRTIDGQPLIDPDQFHVHVLTMIGIPLTAGCHEVASQQSVDLFDEDAITERLDRIETRYGIDYILSLDEEHQMQCATLREQYGCFGRSPEQLLVFRNKLLMKRRLLDVVKLPEYSALSSYYDALAFITRHGKSVIKPVAGFGSERTFVVNDIIDLRMQLANSFIHWPDYEIESYIDGTMIHIDAVVDAGRVETVRVSKYLTSTLDYYFGEPLMATHVPATSEVHRLATRLLQRVIDVLQIRSAVVHLEGFDTGVDELTFCEIGIRPGGGGIRSQFQATTGIDLFEVFLKLELNQAICARANKSSQLAGYVLFPPKSGAVKRVSDIAEFTDPWISTKRIYTSVGEQLSPTSCCLGKTALFTVTADDIDIVIDRLDQLRQRFRLSVSNDCCA